MRQQHLKDDNWNEKWRLIEMNTGWISVNMPIRLWQSITWIGIKVMRSEDLPRRCVWHTQNNPASSPASLSASLSAFLAAFLSAFRFSLSLFLFGSEELFGSSTQRSISFKSSRQRQLAGYKQDRKKERMKERKRERKEGVLTGRRRRREKSNAESQPEIVFKYQR